VVVTSFATDEKVFPAMKAGALGYLLKDAEPEELVRAIRLAHQGEAALDPSIARKVMQELVQPARRPMARVGLSEREMEVLKLLARGLSNNDIAEQLVISQATVRTHVSSILAKLQLASRTQAALYALREGIARLDDV
jgi:NarL family two-component system response regulator LiaR